MNARILTCGVLGGVFVATALSGRLLGPFGGAFGGGGGSMLFDLLALLALAGAGYTAARWSWAQTVDQRLKCGILAGILAAIVAYPLIVAPAAAAESQAPAFDHGPGPTYSDREFLNIVCE